MLRNLVINNKSVPVPVPIVSLAEGVEWIKSTFLDSNRIITKIVLNDDEIFDELSLVTPKKINDSDKLICTIESPLDLVISSIDVLGLYSDKVSEDIRALVVNFWNKPSYDVSNLRSLFDEIDEMSKIFDNLCGLLEENYPGFVPIKGSLVIIKSSKEELIQCVRSNALKDAAKILILRYYEWIKNIKEVCDDLVVKLRLEKNSG